MPEHVTSRLQEEVHDCPSTVTKAASASNAENFPLPHKMSRARFCSFAESQKRIALFRFVF
jgi:hypothetical protein